MLTLDGELSNLISQIRSTRVRKILPFALTGRNELVTCRSLHPNCKKVNFHLFSPISREYWPANHRCFTCYLQSKRFVLTTMSVWYPSVSNRLDLLSCISDKNPFISKSIGRYSPTRWLHRIGMRSTALWIRLLRQGGELSLHAS